VWVSQTPTGDTVKILDFCLTTHAASERYGAPEGIAGRAENVGIASDVFALCVMWIEMVSLRATSVGDSTWSTTTLQSGGELSAILETLSAGVSNTVWDVIERGLHPSPSRRIADAAMLRKDFAGAWPVVAQAVQNVAATPTVSTATTATATATPVAPKLKPKINPGGASHYSNAVMASLFLLLLGACIVLFSMRRRTRVVTVPRVAQLAEYNPPTLPPAARPTRPPVDDNRVYVVPESESAPSRGPRNAPVTLVVFSDFQCPYCARLVPTFERLHATYGERLRIVWRNQPLSFHQRAMPAAEAAVEVFSQMGSNGFWRYHDLLFANHTDLSDETLVRLAGEVRANTAQLREALISHRHQEAIRADMEVFRAIGTRGGTPTCFVNGRMVRGARPYEHFAAAVDRALAEGRR
jgi:protein-disulfide isomerase